MKINMDKLSYWIIIMFVLFISKNISAVNISAVDVKKGRISNEVEILNGRLSFKDKDHFINYYRNMKEIDEEKLADFFEKNIYSKGFHSLKPIVNEKTESKQFERHFSEIKKLAVNKSNGIDKKKYLNHIDNLEQVFGESLFESFLNQNAEIKISDEIYQYTDHGLFIVNLKNYKELTDFKSMKLNIHSLGDINNIQNRNPCDILTDIQDIQKTSSNYIKAGYNRVAPNVRHYMNARLSYLCAPGDGNLPPGDGNPPLPNNYNETYAEIALASTTLDICSGSEPWFPGLFGTVKVCKDRYRSKKRVKTKYWDVDFGLGYSIGVKVKHQKRGWTGLWRKQSTDKVALGINSITWEFDIPNPVFPPTFNLARVYADGLAWETVLDNSQANMYPLGSVAVPNLPFDVDAIVEFATILPIDGGLTSEYKVRQKFYGLLYNKVKDLLRSERNKDLEKIGVVVRTQTHVYVQYYDFTKFCSNCKRQRKVFDWGIITPQINYTFGEGSPSIDTNLSALQFDFNQSRSTGANIFGMAKRSGSWHGSRMIFEQEN